MVVLDEDNFDRTTTNEDWVKSSSNPLTAGVYGDPAVFYEDGTWYVFCDDLTTDGIVYFSGTSPTSLTLGSEVLSPGTSGEWDDSQVRDPTIQKIGSTYYMWYTGSRNTAITDFKIGLATSSSLTSGWTKHGSNPIFSRASEGCGEPSVIYEPDDATNPYKMLITAGPGGSPSELGYEDIAYLTSSDGVSWTDHGDCLSGPDEYQDQEFYKIGGDYIMLVNVHVNKDMKSTVSNDPTSFATPSTASGFGPGESYDADEALAPSALFLNGTWYCYYQGHVNTGPFNYICLATRSTLNWWSRNNYIYWEISSNRLKNKSATHTGWERCRRAAGQDPSYVMTTDIYFESENSTGYCYGIAVADDTSDTNHYVIIFDPSDNKIAMYETPRPEETTGGTVSDLHTSTSFTTGTWYKLRATVTSTNIIIDFYDGSNWVNGVIDYSGTFGVGHCGYYAYYGGAGGDNIFQADNFKIETIRVVDRAANRGMTRGLMRGM